ncbi:MAG: amidohydrolase family protein [Gemmatimonadaceae bacterium]
MSFSGIGVFGRLTLAATLLATTVAAQAAKPAAAPSSSVVPAAYAIRNATIVPVVGPRISGGTVVIRNGRIEAVGAAVAVPPDATAIDGTGMFVYPGLIDSGTQLGLVEIESVPGGIDTQELGELNPSDVTLTAINVNSEIIPTVRVNGITSAISAAGGNLVSGQAALIDLAGWNPQEAAVNGHAAMVVVYPRVAGGRGARFRAPAAEDPADAMNRQVRQLRDYFAEAKAYADLKGKTSATPDGTWKPNLSMEAMLPVMRGEMPVLFDVQTAGQIRGALALADSFHLKAILRGAREGWMLADTLAARKIPVIVGPTTESPDMDSPYDEIYANPGVLAKAGVKIAFQTASASDSRNLPYNAALAVAYGLDADEALRALTINPAQIWGVGDRYGSIEAGKVANIIVTTGDPLDVRSTVQHLFIRGQEISLMDRHRRLYEQFRARPKR